MQHIFQIDVSQFCNIPGSLQKYNNKIVQQLNLFVSVCEDSNFKLLNLFLTFHQ